jgi:hypothetical protein
MPEIWENPFGNAQLKIERAKKHTADIDERLQASSDRYGPSLHINADTGKQFLHYGLTDRFLRSDIALIVGDAIHNLHSALDIAYRETIRVISPNGFSPSKTKFIVGNDRKHLETSLTCTARVDPASRLFDFLVEHVKSYKGKGGDADICAIHALDIDDKHHLLIPMLAVTGIEGVELESEDGTIDRYTIVLTRPNSYRKAVPFGSKLKNHGQVIFKITFGQGTALDDAEVVPTLNRFYGKTREIVREFQRIIRESR